MKIYSWNMLFLNRRPEKAFAFIRDADFDIFCLQEVPERFLEQLRELPYEIAVAPETDCSTAYKHATMYLVILSKHPIRSSKQITLPEYTPSFYARAFSYFMHTMRLWAKLAGNRHSLYADIETPYGLVRTFCMHLPLTNPSMRAEEFELALAHRDPSLPSIVCGDFNVLESPHVTPFNWLLGGTIRDAISTRRERRHLEERFFAYELINAHRGRSTHLVSHSQLDHILIPKGFAIADARVMRRKYGSDHRPLFAEISAQAKT